MCVTYTAQRNQRILDLVCFNEEITVRIVGEVEFCLLHCCSSIVRYSFSGCCDIVSDITVPVCMTGLNIRGAFDST